MSSRRLYNVYLLSGVLVGVSLAVVALVTADYLWVIVGAGGSVSCLWRFLSRRRGQENALPNKSAIVRWRDRNEHGSGPT